MNDLALLEHFAAVYRSGSFRDAAEALGVSQSAVTKRVQMLEERIGLRLFNRTTRSVEPTDGARQLIGKAEQALRSVSAFGEEARLLVSGQLGGIRVGAIALAAETLIVRALARLAAAYPNLEVDVVVGSSDVYRDLATGECDVAVGDEANLASSPHADALRVQRLRPEKLVFVHRDGHPARDPRALLRHPLAIPSRYFNENRLFEALRQQSDPVVTPRYRLNSLSACVSLAAASDVVTLAPESFVEQIQNDGTGLPVRVAPIDTTIQVRPVLLTMAPRTTACARSPSS